MILLLFACASTERADASRVWTPEAAIVALRERLDTDDDGRIDAQEWSAHAPYGPAFPRVDADGDGDVSPGELVRLARGVDPAAWLEATARTQPDRRVPARGEVSGATAHDPAPLEALSPPARPYLQALRADLLAAPGCDASCARQAPPPRDIDALGDATLDSGAARALLTRVQGLYERVGMRFPEGV